MWDIINDALQSPVAMWGTLAVILLIGGWGAWGIVKSGAERRTR